MNIHDLIRELHEANDSKIVLVVADGLGGLPLEPGGKTELETARTTKPDTLARDGVCGLSIPLPPGPARALAACRSPSCPASPRAVAPATSACSATTRSSTRSAAASWKR